MILTHPRRIVIAVVALSSCSSGSAGTDAGLDATVADSGADVALVDAHADASADVMADVALSDAGADGDGGVEITILATTTGLPRALAVDDTNVYWTDITGKIVACAKTGCGGTPTVLASGQDTPLGIAVDSTTVYWTDEGDVALVDAGLAADAAALADAAAGSVVSCPIVGCDAGATLLASAQRDPRVIAVSGSNVYWSNAGYANNGSVMTCSSGGCGGMPTALLSGGFPEAIAVDTTNVYVVNVGYGTVTKCALAGCGGSPQVLASGESDPFAIAVDSTNVYWSTLYGTYQVRMCAKSGCGGTPTTLWTSTTSVAWAIVSDGINVYWTTIGDGTLVKCAVGGCGGFPTVLASSLSYPYAVAVDATSVYYQSGSQVLKLTPK